ncbi:MAG: aminotransferase class III-fold pyridoxal phosphate-dependent enzyme, partial [Alphaproteobacteria bacterium]|nr:aminotransferase class III-fold pyridoxal phosphate-dependent enzyme [Alphaproteobacteria bacterium]
DVMLADGFLTHVRDMGARLLQGLGQAVKNYPKIFQDVRGRGLMIGIVCVDDPKPLFTKLRENRLLTVLAGGNVVRMLPPLITEEEQIDEALEILSATCAQLGEGS